MRPRRIAHAAVGSIRLMTDVDKMEFTDPSCNTVQGVLHQRKCLGEKPQREMKVKRGAIALFESGMQHQPIWNFCDRFERERCCSDPKDGELLLIRAKPWETLVEARKDADVQIAPQNCQ